MAESYIADAFKVWMRQRDTRDIPDAVHEFHFHPHRKWRFDFAWPGHKVALEIEGITYDVGRHQRVDGFMKDAEKYAAAMRLGWHVFRVPGPWIATTDGFVFDERVTETLRVLLDLPNTACGYCGDPMVANRELEVWECVLCDHAAEPG